MARTTISLPDDLKSEMDKLDGDVNWSALAAETFLSEIKRIKSRKAALKGKPMNVAIERLRESKQAYLGAASERGKTDGTTWAMQSAEYGQLKGIAQHWEQTETCETDDAYGSPGVFLRMIRDDDEGGPDRDDINNFWVGLGKEYSDADKYSANYWNGFVKGALEVFEKVDA